MVDNCPQAVHLSWEAKRLHSIKTNEELEELAHWIGLFNVRIYANKVPFRQVILAMITINHRTAAYLEFQFRLKLSNFLPVILGRRFIQQAGIFFVEVLSPIFDSGAIKLILLAQIAPAILFLFGTNRLNAELANAHRVDVCV